MSGVLDLLFQRPLEPISILREKNEAAFASIESLPEASLPQYQKETSFSSQTLDDKVQEKDPVNELESQALAIVKPIGMMEPFSVFQDHHMKIAAELIEILLKANINDLKKLCHKIRDSINPVLFQYSYSVAIQHRKDTRHIKIPPIAEIFPANFVDPSIFREARKEAFLNKDPSKRRPVIIPQNYTASDREDEQRMAYFREDIGVNEHHWHWHLVYPSKGLHEIVAKDRRGELFYYMHHQIVARYNVDRFCNNLERTKALKVFREPILEGYFPKLLSSVNNRTYPARSRNTILYDLDRVNNIIEIDECVRWQERILAAIDRGIVVNTSGEQIRLDEVHGIDLLGNIIEASSLSINPKYYGDLHNMVHNLISFAHDPDNRNLEEFSVMGDVTTAMRDPIFYRWHAYLDTIFDRFKTTLNEYDKSHLGFKEITINKKDSKISSCSDTPNCLVTYWQRSVINIAAALDFGPDGGTYASFIHLQHDPFEYVFSVSNSSRFNKKGTCRIFICPQKDVRGITLNLEEQRLLAIELDKFTVNLKSGNNIIRRRSDESAVTISFEQSFRRDVNSEQTRFCGCGWPDHMLLPRGKVEGMTFDLFVMISDYTGDDVTQTNSNIDDLDECATAFSFCGLQDKLYPDRRAMGFPFDRRLPNDDLSKLIELYPNMMMMEVTITFKGEVVEKKKQ